MTDQSPPNANAPTPDTNQQDSSSGLTKVLLGCGCGVLLLVFVCTGATAALWYTSSSFLPDDAEGLVRKLATIARSQSGAGAADAGGSFAANMLSPEDVRAELGKPLSHQQARSFTDTLGELTSTPEFKDQQGAAESIRNVAQSEGDAGTLEALKGAWSFSEYATGSGKLDKAFRRVLGDSGERQEFFSRMTRVAALMAAADYTATQIGDDSGSKPDPLSQQVADRMVEQRPKLSEKYRSEYKKAQKSLGEAKAPTGDEMNPEKLREYGKRVQKADEAMKMAAQPGMVAYGRLHADSFDTWSTLGKDGRQQLVDNMYDISSLLPFARKEDGLTAFQYVLTSPERARLQPGLTQ